jgi:hypothetical protein
MSELLYPLLKSMADKVSAAPVFYEVVERVSRLYAQVRNR